MNEFRPFTESTFESSRRDFLKFVGLTAGALFATGNRAATVIHRDEPGVSFDRSTNAQPATPITLFLSGDVMTGRGIDQVLPDSVAPRLYEPYLTDAREYVRLAEMANGSIPKPVDYAYIWGDALEELVRAAPDIRIINLETAVTVSDQFWPRKGINYRMHPKNSEVLRAASIDCCVLANNHVLDWGYTGLAETLTTLEQSGIKYAGAGQNKAAAQAPAVIAVANKGRVLVFSIAAQSSGVPGSWAAGRRRAGVHLIADYSEKTIDTLASLLNEYRRPGDMVVVSIHWGGNWGYSVSKKEQAFAHGLIDTAGIDLLHGHSSHHVKGIEVYKGKPILYGCGDLINDYEGIRGHKEYRGDLSLMYLPSLNPNDGRLVQFRLVPMQIRRFRLQRATQNGTRWLEETLNREGEQFGTRVVVNDDGTFELRW